MKKPLGLIVYRGPSMLDHAPIVGIITGLQRQSKNTKTGGALQLWILREDISPLTARFDGRDYSICGNCIHRKKQKEEDEQLGTCYVNVAKAPTMVWKAYKRGRYEQATFPLMQDHVIGRSLRLGAYGDPAALPLPLVRQLTYQAKTLGYTHQTALLPRKNFTPFLMASCESLEQANQFWKTGARTFRVLRKEEKPEANEILCPASVEMGQRTTCENCNLCNGTKENDSRKNIAIYAHGSSKNRFETVEV